MRFKKSDCVTDMIVISIELATDGPTTKLALLSIKAMQDHPRYPLYDRYEVRLDGRLIHYITGFRRDRGEWPLIKRAIKVVPDGG